MACFCCSPVDLVQAQAKNFAEGLFQQLTAPTLSLFGAILLVYSLYLLLDALLRGSINFGSTLKVIFGICIIRWSLHFEVFRDWFLLPLTNTVLALSSKVIAFACGKGGIILANNTSTGLIEAFEQIFLNVLTIAKEMKDASMWIQFQAWFVSFLSALPFAISLAYLIFAVVGYHLSMAVVASLGPIWILFFLLPATRGMCYAAIRILVANSIELILISVIITFSIVCIKTSIAGIATDEVARDSVPFLGKQGLILLVLGFVSLFAQTLASSMAGTIAGAPTTNKSFTSALAGTSLMGAAASRYLPFAKAARTAAVKTGKRAGQMFGQAQESLVDSEIAGSMGRSIHYGLNQAWEKLTDFKRFH